ncbi:MAG TPA: response regulator [Anaerolineae bacterium]|nr:response regulator [Anaerolineae bacterium]
MSKILVIDDEELVRANLVELLEMENYEVLGAANGRVGVQLARQHLPELIICDIMMPELDGYGVLGELRQDAATATIPFIFLTAKTEKSDMRQGMSLGADDYLVKPFTRQEILEAISARLAKQAAFIQKTQSKLDDLRSAITLALPHELRTPLTGILGYSELLMEDAATLPRQDIQDVARNIHFATKRLQDLVMNFLLYAELALARRDPEYALTLKDLSPCYIEPVVTEVAAQQAQWAHREADLQLEVERASVSLGGVYLAKLVKEVIHNAFKFSWPGTPVHVTGSRSASHYQLSIENYGRGMTPEQIADVGAYFQFERKHYEQQGQGLGLNIAKWIAELHGGKMTIASVPGERTIVQFLLPLCLNEMSGIDDFYTTIWHE